MELAWTQSSRRHRIGAHARSVINTIKPTAITTADGSDGLLWVGPDDRGLELEVVAVDLPELYLVIHVMPTTLKGGASVAGDDHSHSSFHQDRESEAGAPGEPAARAASARAISTPDATSDRAASSGRGAARREHVV